MNGYDGDGDDYDPEMDGDDYDTDWDAMDGDDFDQAPPRRSRRRGNVGLDLYDADGQPVNFSVQLASPSDMMPPWRDESQFAPVRRRARF